MKCDDRVALVLSHNTPRYLATGVDPSDFQRIVSRLDRWENWCRIWSEEAGRHESQGEEAAELGRSVTATDLSCGPRSIFIMGSTCSPMTRSNTLVHTTGMLRCYRAAVGAMDPAGRTD